MASRILKFTAAGSTNLQPISSPTGRVVLMGYEIYNVAAAARFVKLYWGAPGSFASAGDKPTVGTDVPAITIGIPTVSRVAQAYTSGPTGNGLLYVATTVLAADSDTTAVTSGDLIVSLFWE